MAATDIEKDRDSPLLTRQQAALTLYRRGWSRRRIARELGIGVSAASRLLRRALSIEPGSDSARNLRRPKPQRIRPLSLAHYV